MNTDSDLKQQAQWEILTKVNRMAPLELVANVFIILACAYIFHDEIPEHTLNIWMAAIFLSLLLRTVIAWDFGNININTKYIHGESCFL